MQIFGGRCYESAVACLSATLSLDKLRDRPQEFQELGSKHDKPISKAFGEDVSPRFVAISTYSPIQWSKIRATNGKSHPLNVLHRKFSPVTKYKWRQRVQRLSPNNTKILLQLPLPNHYLPLQSQRKNDAQTNIVIDLFLSFHFVPFSTRKAFTPRASPTTSTHMNIQLFVFFFLLLKNKTTHLSQGSSPMPQITRTHLTSPWKYTGKKIRILFCRIQGPNNLTLTLQNK